MFKRINISFFSLAMLLFIGVGQSNAQVKRQLQIGYVNPQTILQKMPEMKAVRQRMQNFIDKKNQAMSDKRDAFQQKVADYQKKQSSMSNDAQQKREKELGQLQSDLQKSQRQAQQAIQQKQQELVNPLYENITNSIQNVAKERNLSYVINTEVNTGDQVILYASDSAKKKYDITGAVMDDLGIGQ